MLQQLEIVRLENINPQNLTNVSSAFASQMYKYFMCDFVERD